MDQTSHSNETWQLLSRVNARVLGEDEQQHDQNRRQDGDSGSTDQQRADEQKRYVDYRLRELRAWERGLGIAKRNGVV